MSSERFVVLGLGQARSAWFRAVAAWSNSGALPVEFVKCVSAEEVRVRLRSPRPFSALVVDAGLPGIDRDLVAAAGEAGCAVLVVDDPRVPRDWSAVGATAVLPDGFTRDDLVEALARNSRAIPRGEAQAVDAPERPPPSPWRGAVVAVTGPGGTGASTAAIALAQALGDDVRYGGTVLLADLRLHAEQAMLHDAGDVIPSVQELVESHRGGHPGGEEVRRLAFGVPVRNYHLLLGLRRARFWPAIRPRAFEAAFQSLRRAWRVTVCDVDPDLEGEDDVGSADVEDRNVMARTAMAEADAVLAVGTASLKGLHSLARTVDGLVAFGVSPDRIVPVFNRMPHGQRARSAMSSTLRELVAGAGSALGERAHTTLAPPVFLPERKVEEALHDGVRLPAGLGAPLAAAVAPLIDQPVSGAAGLGQPVRPGSLGHWHDQEAAG